jgi:hypothetical protein
MASVSRRSWAEPGGSGDVRPWPAASPASGAGLPGDRILGCTSELLEKTTSGEAWLASCTRA